MVTAEIAPRESTLQPEQLQQALESIAAFFAILAQEPFMGEAARAAAVEAHDAALVAAVDLTTLAESAKSIHERIPGLLDSVQGIEDLVGRLSNSLMEEEWPAGG